MHACESACNTSSSRFVTQIEATGLTFDDVDGEFELVQSRLLELEALQNDLTWSKRKKRDAIVSPQPRHLDTETQGGHTAPERYVELIGVQALDVRL